MKDIRTYTNYQLITQTQSHILTIGVPIFGYSKKKFIWTYLNVDFFSL